MNIAKDKNTIIFLSPTPPPYMGPSVATQIILNSKFIHAFNVIHIDTADRRSLNNLGRIDLFNIYLALKHYCLLLQQLLFSKADLVYVPISQTSIGFLRDIPFILLSKLFRKKVVLHLRGGYFREFYDSSSIVMRFLIRRSLKSIDRMIVLGNSLRIILDGLIPKRKVSVIPNGLDIVFDAANRDNKDQDQIIVLFLSNLQKTKGFWDVLYSLNSVIQKHNKVKYIFAGGWIGLEDMVKCKKYMKQQMIGDYVDFKGLVTGKDKIRLLQNADIFAFPTYYPMEGHPWVIVEAMAAGLPIITTDQGCIKESVIDGDNVFIVPYKTPDAIAEKILYLIEHPEIREEMGHRSRQIYEANFTEDHFVQRMIEVMKETMGEGD